MKLRNEATAAATLKRWLDAGAGHDAEYAGELSNHLPMALCALYRLGADAARLQAFAQAYAQRLRAHVRSSEPGKLIDTLIVGAFIEARSCERFYRLAPCLDEELAKFYRSLLKSESRHYQDYLTMAASFSTERIDERVSFFAAIEREAILTPDTGELWTFYSDRLAKYLTKSGNKYVAKPVGGVFPIRQQKFGQ